MPTRHFQTKTSASGSVPGKRITGIGASPRRGGNSDVLLNHLMKGAKRKGVPVEKVHLREYRYAPCTGCERCRKDRICTGLKDGMNLIYPMIWASRGLILVSPTHNYNITAWMKAFIDRLYCFYDFDRVRPGAWSSRLGGQARKAVLAAVCDQESRKDMGFTLKAMRLPLEALGYEIVGELAVLGIFGRGKVKEREEILADALKLGAKLAQSL